MYNTHGGSKVKMTEKKKGKKTTYKNKRGMTSLRVQGGQASVLNSFIPRKFTYQTTSDIATFTLKIPNNRQLRLDNGVPNKTRWPALLAMESKIKQDALHI